MKKTLSSITFIALFGLYALYHNGVSQGALALNTPTAADVSTPISARTSTTKTVATTSTPPAKQQPPAATSQGKYKDGTYLGSSANAYYGNVQVQVTIASGKIATVSFLDYPQDRGTSRAINTEAIPLLTQEAIKAQSANVSGVSGASDTSAAFRQSLAVALSKAA